MIVLNNKPIFLNAFSRGGSNILWNVFLTHPDVCSPILETVEIFRIGRRGRLSGYQAVWHTRQLQFFNQMKLAPRRPISAQAQQFIDATLHDWKLKTFTDGDMRFKAANQTYSMDEVIAARLCAKNNNGLAFLSDVLYSIYPEAVLIGLVRDPIALYESHKRRRIARSVGEFARRYNAIGGKMLEDSEAHDSYHIVRFEDVLMQPVKMALHLYELAGLDADRVQQLRFKAKAHYQPNGTHTTQYVQGKHYWFDFEEVVAYFQQDINQLQISKLDPRERAAVWEQTQHIAERLGYANDSTS